MGQYLPSSSRTVCFQSYQLSVRICSLSSRLLSIHLRLGRPLLHYPGTTMSIIFLDKLSSSLLLICPYKFNRFCLRNVDIWDTLASSCMIWFLTWSFLVLPLIHRSILIFATCNLFSSFFLTAQHSAPYVIVGLITVLYTLSFSLMGTFLSQSTPVSCFHFIQASLTWLLVSLSAPPFESNIDPKYLNVVTVFSLSPLVVTLHSFWDCCYSHCTASTLF